MTNTETDSGIQATNVTLRCCCGNYMRVTGYNYAYVTNLLEKWLRHNCFQGGRK